MRLWFVKIITLVVIAIVAAVPSQVKAEDTTPMDDDEMEAVLAGALENDTLVAEEMAELNEHKAVVEQMRKEGMFKALKRKFIEGNAGFMSLVALVLILGLAFCVERIIYLTLSEVNSKKLLEDVDAKIEEGDIEGAKDICRETRGPVASICYQGLMRAEDSVDSIFNVDGGKFIKAPAGAEKTEEYLKKCWKEDASRVPAA